MLHAISKNVYYMEHNDDTDRPALGLVVGEKHSLIIDSGTSPRHARDFIKEVNKLNIASPKYLILTHWHWDHVLGISEMKLITIANNKSPKDYEWMKNLRYDDESLNRAVEQDILSKFNADCLKVELENRDTFKMADIDIWFSDKLQIDLGNLVCIIENVGGDHTSDSTIIYIPKAKTIFLGDCIYGGRYNGVYGYTEKRTKSMLHKLRQYDTDYAIISHQPLIERAEIISLYNELETCKKINE